MMGLTSLAMLAPMGLLCVALGLAGLVIGGIVAAGLFFSWRSRQGRKERKEAEAEDWADREEGGSWDGGDRKDREDRGD